MKKILAVFLTFLLLLTPAPAAGRVAALLSDDARGHAAGAALEGLAARDGAEILVSYAADGDAQLAQFDELDGVDALIVMPLCAPEIEIPTVALEGDLEGAACRVDFDPDAEAALLADEILALTEGATEPLNVEFAAGEREKDALYEKALSLLAPAFDDGRLCCLSGQTAFGDVATGAEVFGDTAARLEELFMNVYEGRPLAAILCTDPYAAIGALQAVFFGYDGEELPVIAASGCEAGNLTNIIDGLQTMCAFRDPRLTAQAAWDAACDLQSGRPVGEEILCAPTRLDAANAKELAYGSGLFEEDEYGYPVGEAPEEEIFGAAEEAEEDQADM